MIKEILKDKVLVLDGAMGTMIQRYKLEEEDYRGEIFKTHHLPLKGNNDLLSLTRPNVIKEIHRAYLEAGCDIIETNTFSSTSIGMADYELSDEDLIYRLNFESAKIAKEVCNEFTDKPRFVAGSIGPTNKTLSMSSDVNNPGDRSVTFDELKYSYKTQIKGLIDGGSDLILIETIFDSLNARACLKAIKEMETDIPVMISGTIIDSSGRTLSGQTVEAFLISMSHYPLLSIGFNCSLGADSLLPYVNELKSKSNFMISAHPNAGLPNALGHYDQTPEDMGELIKGYLDRDLVNIIGGCCGTTPDHLRVISKLVDTYNLK